MKKDKFYSTVIKCSKTVGGTVHNNIDGCPVCGEPVSHHSEFLQGRWVRPSWVEYIYQGKRRYFETVTGERIYEGEV